VKPKLQTVHFKGMKVTAVAVRGLMARLMRSLWLDVCRDV
jgi:hypothetical protein